MNTMDFSDFGDVGRSVDYVPATKMPGGEKLARNFAIQLKIAQKADFAPEVTYITNGDGTREKKAEVKAMFQWRNDHYVLPVRHGTAVLLDHKGEAIVFEPKTREQLISTIEKIITKAREGFFDESIMRTFESVIKARAARAAKAEVISLN